MKMHGGDIYGVAEQLGIPVESCHDFSANINPSGVPESVKEAIKQAVDRVIHYPDPDCQSLTKALSGKLSVPEKYILCGNGGADLLYRIVYAARPRKAVLPAPTFLEYGEALAQTGTEICHYRMKETMEIGLDIAEWITEETDMIFLCNPNNPTGLLIDPAVLETVLRKAERTKTRVVLDECFLDFVEDGQNRSMIGRVGEYRQLVIVRSFTKLYGIPGVRLGYGICSDPDFLERVRRAGQTWPVSSLAQAAGLAALREENFEKETVACVGRQRRWMKEELVKAGFQVYDGQADYLFFRAPGEPELYEKMLSYGIIIRRCGNYENLTPEHYRVAVRKQEENEALIRCLRKVSGIEAVSERRV